MANTAFITSSASAPKGVLFVAPVGTPMPKNAVEKLDEAFQDMGTISDAGVTQNIERETTKVKNYGGETIYVLQNSYDNTFDIEVVESVNAVTLKGIFGDANVDNSDPNNIVVKHNKAKLARCSVVVDHLIDQGLVRHAVEVGQITLSGEVNRTHEDIVKYKLKVDTFPGSDGNNLMEYIAIVDDAGNATTELQVATSVLKDTTVGTKYSANVLASGGSEPYTFTVSAGTLPAGLELSTAGAITGTPTGTAGTSKFTVQVADKTGTKATKELSIKVNAA